MQDIILYDTDRRYYGFKCVYSSRWFYTIKGDIYRKYGDGKPIDRLKNA